MAGKAREQGGEEGEAATMLQRVGISLYIQVTSKMPVLRYGVLN
uniref:B1248C03.17 protein n=1 Tax=Oryza sativa subsp. japonica TaxID=39947 RepID=Q6MW80_ORYSJ|nr:B1248C03.17 [Oryza sativa Japonica Group]CAE76065.1 B1340F09.3 [Oryza sativa Japonica Group]